MWDVGGAPIDRYRSTGGIVAEMMIGMTVAQQATLEATLAGFEQGAAVGVHSLWFSQPPSGFDALTVLAMAAGRTHDVRLGTAAIPTFPSHPLLTARTVQTAAAAAPGRIVLGVGAGHRSWVEQEYGLRFDRPVRQIIDWVRTVRRLLNGESLAASDNAFGLSVAASDVAVDVPIILAGTGPHMLAAAGRVADGVMTWMCDETYLAEVVGPAIARGATRAGRAVPPLTAGVLICVSDDADRAHSALRPRLASLGDYASYRAVLSHGGRDARGPVDVSVIGTEAEVSAALGRLTRVGVSELVCVILPDPHVPAESIARARRLLTELASHPGRQSALLSPPDATEVPLDPPGQHASADGRTP